MRTGDIRTGIPEVDRQLRRIVDVINRIEQQMPEFHTVNGEPTRGLGKDGDEAFDRESETFYKKADNIWHEV